jgi:class 3 adenylate cyclase
LTARVALQLAAHAGRGDILASRLVAELATGSGLHFADAGRITLDELGER